MLIFLQYDEYFSKEIEAAWAALCGVRETNVQLIIEYLILMAGICGSPALPHVRSFSSRQFTFRFKLKIGNWKLRIIIL